ncbi:MAG: TIGR03617 family F420-dependent LLM class oxidoreductase [Chromatiales bacterium]|jgi:probable F420-dependent oxidoreductase|nr:TIGR03617 family F420-dependent LLM class oxidoreductase [Chromatiales bacterium]
MKFDVGMRNLALKDVGAEAKRYEDIGFDTVWTFETAHDPFFPLAQVAMATERLRFGTNIAVAFARSPFVTAQIAWDLQGMSGGRMVLGLGTQVRAHVERRFSMQFEHPAARVTDYIDTLRAIWRTFQTGERPTHRGPFYQFTVINDFFTPGPIEHPDVPVWLAGVNERMCRAAGEVADGFQVHPMHSPGYIHDVVRPSLREGAARRDRDADAMELHIPVFAVSGDTAQERAESELSVRQQVAFYSSTPSYRRFLEYHDCMGVAKDLSDLMRKGEIEKMTKLVPDALMDAVAISGNGAQLGQALRARCEAAGVQSGSLYQSVLPETPIEHWQGLVRAFQAA